MKISYHSLFLILSISFLKGGAASAHPESEVTLAVAAHLAVHRIEHLIAIKKLDVNFEKAFKKVSIEALVQKIPTDPAFRAVSSQYACANGAVNRVGILMDKKGKSAKETVLSGGCAPIGQPNWTNKSGITLTELANHFVLDAIETDAKLDTFIDALTEVEVSQAADNSGIASALVDFKSSTAMEVYRVKLGMDGKVIESNFVKAENE